MKIVSWNCQGLKLSEGVRALVSSEKPDILTLQECGNLKGTSIKFDSSKTELNPLIVGEWQDYLVFYYPWRNFSRCSMASFVKNDLECKSPYYYIDVLSDPEDKRADSTEDKSDKSENSDELRKGLRAALCVEVKDRDHSYLICNIHLLSGQPAFARKVGYKYLDTLSYNPFMIMIGDFNTEPHQWKSLKSMLRLVNSGVATHESGSELDYMITNIHNRISASVLDSCGSDHCPVMFEF